MSGISRRAVLAAFLFGGLAAAGVAAGGPPKAAQPRTGPLITVGQSRAFDTVDYDVTGGGFEAGAEVFILPPAPGGVEIWGYADANGKIDISGKIKVPSGTPLNYQAEEYRILGPGESVFLGRSNVYSLTAP